jgi:hypothetical protein
MRSLIDIGGGYHRGAMNIIQTTLNLPIGINYLRYRGPPVTAQNSRIRSVPYSSI